MQNAGSDITTVDAKDVKKLLDENQNIIILDVRTPMEVKNGRIPQSINIPLDEIEERVEKALPDKKKSIYAYCLSGSRSIFAAALLKKMGYSNVFNVQSGMLSWRANKFPIDE